SRTTCVRTYFGDPVAIAGTTDAISFAGAMAARAGRLVVNCVLAAILGATGSTTAILGRENLATKRRKGNKSPSEFCALFVAKNYYFFGAPPRMASFAAFATRNFRTVFAGILISSPVAGLRPMRAFLFCFTIFPRPWKGNSPFFASRYARSTYAAKKSLTCFFATPVFVDISLMICVWVIFAIKFLL